jgi:hypothetical protein
MLEVEDAVEKVDCGGGRVTQEHDRATRRGWLSP